MADGLVESAADSFRQVREGKLGTNRQQQVRRARTEQEVRRPGGKHRRDDTSSAERGKVTGTPVGCACGDGVIDWEKVIAIIRKGCPRDIVLSVECGTVEQAERSIEHLQSLALCCQ